MKKVKAFIMLGVIVSTLLIGCTIGYGIDVDAPDPPHGICAYK